MSGVIHILDTSTDPAGTPRPAKDTDFIGGGGGGGDASAANQLTEIARLEAIRDRLPANFLTPGLLAVDTLGTPGLTWHLSATSAASSPLAIPTTVRRVSIDARVDCWVRFGGAAAAVPAGNYGLSFPVAAGAIKDFATPAGTTVSVLRAGTTDGSVFVTELA